MSTIPRRLSAPLLLRCLFAAAWALILPPAGKAQGPYDPGSALSFDGVADGTVPYVDVPHSTALNSYPFTVSVWVRTTENSPLVRGVVSKYADGSFNGWTLFLYEGQIHAWYLTPAGRVLRDPLGLLSGLVTDGQWHHVVFTVGPVGGVLYVDGVVKDSIGWTNGAPAPPTAAATQPVRIGRYHTYPNGFKGDIDEVTVWSRELNADFVRLLGNRGPIGTETGLVGSWRFDNGAGNALTDSTAAARHGTLFNSPGWIASDAPVRRTDPAGDEWWNVLSKVTSASFTRTWIITDSPSPLAPEINVAGNLIRLDDINLPITSNDVPVTYTVAVEDAADSTPVPLAQDTFTQPAPTANHSVLLTIPVVRAVPATIPLVPAGGLAEYLPGHSYRATVTMTHQESDGSVLNGGSITTAAASFTVLSGHLFFGGIDTIFTALLGAPTVAPGGVTLSIPANGAYLAGYPERRFGGTFLASIDPVTHHATILSGSVTVTGPAVDTDSMNGIRFRRGTITLFAFGANASVTVCFPTGFGYTLSDQVRILESSFAASSALTQELRPANPLLSYTPAIGTLFVCEESKPLLFRATGIQCDLTLGVVRATGLASAQSVRKKEVTDLAAATGLPAGATRKPSNDAWLQTAATVAGPVEVRVGPRGDARLSADGIGTTAATFSTHHPLNAAVSSGAGTVSIIDDQFTSSGSIPLTGPVTIPQGRDCYECLGAGAGAGTLGLSFNSGTGSLGTTPDGGLVANGTLSAATDIQWGYISAGVYAQTVHGVSAGSFMAPGFSLRGDQSARAAADRPGVLLNTGSSTAPDGGTGLYPPERPDSPGYLTGAASYGGFNFQVPGDGALLASCRLGDQFFPNKPLRACCKYYARTSGVTGLHQVLRGSIAGTFPVNGFGVEIDRYRLSYLSNENMDSGINGILTVGGYCRFEQDFAKLFLNCFARMSRLELPPVTVKKTLFYWNAEVRPLTLEFANGGKCPPAAMPDPVLVMGCEAWVSHVQPTLAGRLAMSADGRLLPRKDLTVYLAEFPDLDSTLHLPGSIPLRGPQGSNYSLVPNTPAYFSLPTEPPPEVPNGFLHFAAKTDVAFFEDLRIHVHTSGLQGNTTSPLHIMGGWNVGPQTYWNQATFDPDRAGVPPGVSKEDYRANNNPAYLVKATRNWKGIVKIVDCPMKWNFAARLFSTLNGCNTELPIFSVDTRVNALGPTKTDLRFAKDFLPNFSLGNLAINELTEATGVMTAFQNAGQSLKREAMQRGLEAMESMLQNQIRPLLEQPLNRAIDPFSDQLALSLTVGLNYLPPADGPALKAQFISAFNAAGGAAVLQSQLQTALTAAGDASSLIGEVRRRVVEGRAAAQSIRDILAKDGGGRRHLLPNLAEQLLQQFDSPVIAQLGSAVVRQFLDVQIGELEEAFSSLDETLSELDSAFGRILTSLDGAGNFTSEVTTRMTAIQADIANTINSARDEIGNRFSTFNVSAMNLSAPAAVENLKQDIRRILRDRLSASRISSEMQRILRERLADINDALGSAMDSVFQQVNGMVRSALVKAAAGLDSTFKKFAGAAGGGIAETGAVAKINGHAVILGDKLNHLRVDGDFKLSFMGENGAELELNAFLEVKDVSSRGGPGCGADPGKELTEITIGAEGVKIGWKAGPNLTADLGVKFTLEGDQTSAVPVNFGGYVKVTGGLNFAVLKIKEIALAVAVGKVETFISAGARVEVSGWEFAGGFFAGKACTLDPILLWAPDARQVIGRDEAAPDQSFLGVYFYAEGWIPLNELLGIPSSCLLTIKVGAGMGFFVNLAGAEPEIGAKFLLGLDGEVICLIGVHAEFILRGRKRGLDFSTDGLRMVGEGSLCVEIGPCPFCIEICASLIIIYEDGGWDYEL